MLLGLVLAWFSNFSYKFFVLFVCGFVQVLNPDNLDNLRRLAEQFHKQSPGASATTQEDDKDVPDLVEGETFEAAAEEKKTS